MELYYSPLACSLAAHIVCREARLQVSMRRTDLATKRVEGGGDLLRLNPMGKVPTLVCDDGLVLTENPAVLLYLGDRAPASGLVPEAGTFARYDVVRWLSFVATELHKRVHAQLFALDGPPEIVRQLARQGAAQPLAALERHLGDRQTLVGDAFTVADAHLFWALTLLRPAGISLDPYPAARSYYKRTAKREAVSAALNLEREQYQQPMQGGPVSAFRA